MRLESNKTTHGFRSIAAGRHGLEILAAVSAQESGGKVNPRHDALRRPPGPPRQSTKRPASTSRRALNSPNWTRTSDMRVNSSPLYQLSYRGIGCGTERIPSAAPSSSRWGDLSSERPNRAEGPETRPDPASADRPRTLPRSRPARCMARRGCARGGVISSLPPCSTRSTIPRADPSPLSQASRLSAEPSASRRGSRKRRPTRLRRPLRIAPPAHFALRTSPTSTSRPIVRASPA